MANSTRNSKSSVANPTHAPFVSKGAGSTRMPKSLAAMQTGSLASSLRCGQRHVGSSSRNFAIRLHAAAAESAAGGATFIIRRDHVGVCKTRQDRDLQSSIQKTSKKPVPHRPLAMHMHVVGVPHATQQDLLASPTPSLSHCHSEVTTTTATGIIARARRTPDDE